MDSIDIIIHNFHRTEVILHGQIHCFLGPAFLIHMASTNCLHFALISEQDSQFRAVVSIVADKIPHTKGIIVELGLDD